MFLKKCPVVTCVGGYTLCGHSYRSLGNVSVVTLSVVTAIGA